jgi:hypothetical protein
MEEEKDPNVIELPEFIDVSPEIKAKMSWNEADRAWLLNYLSYHKEVTSTELGHIFKSQNTLLHLKLNMITEGVALFKKNEIAIKRVGKFDERLTKTEKRQTNKAIAIYSGVILALSGWIAFLIDLLRTVNK